MREGMTPEVMGAISAPAITTAYLVRLDFESEIMFVWTGVHPITVMGSGDSLLDGHTFESIAEDLPYEVSENTYTMEGSSEFTISVALSSTPSVSLASSQVYPDEYRSRQATVWRALKIPSADPLSAPVWVFRRVRSGAMDRVEIQNDGRSHIFSLTIESHQSLISNATNQTYLNQKSYDLNDTSQDYAAASANGDPAPSKGSNAAGAANIPSYKFDQIQEMNRIDY